MKAFIKGTSLISPQPTFDIKGFPAEISKYPAAVYLKCIEPSYKGYIDPMVLRRMSRIVKMAVCCALNCMRNSGVENPDAIITGTGLGCLEDTEKFLNNLYASEEHLLNPTPFIQSTHNTIAGAIALSIKCHGYNATYAHRGFSFESAILDAMMHVTENHGANILVGGFDEITPNSYLITDRLGMWKTKPVNRLCQERGDDGGTLPGEGVGFFMFSGDHSKNDLAQLVSVRTLFNPKNNEIIENKIIEFLRDSGLTPRDLDLAILGTNTDFPADCIYSNLTQNILEGIPVIGFKQLCGEFDTSSVFALWLASVIIHSQKFPAMITPAGKTGKIKNVLIFNHLRGINHSMYLLSSC